MIRSKCPRSELDYCLVLNKSGTILNKGQNLTEDRLLKNLKNNKMNEKEHETHESVESRQVVIYQIYRILQKSEENEIFRIP